MAKYRFAQDYRSSYGAGGKGDVIEISDEQAEIINRDSPGTLEPAGKGAEVKVANPAKIIDPLNYDTNPGNRTPDSERIIPAAFAHIANPDENQGVMAYADDATNVVTKTVATKPVGANPGPSVDKATPVEEPETPEVGAPGNVPPVDRNPATGPSNPGAAGASTDAKADAPKTEAKPADAAAKPKPVVNR